MVSLGTTPIGAPIVGWVAQQFGARAGLGIGGMATLIASVVIFWSLDHWHIGTTESESSANRGQRLALNVPDKG